MTSLPASRGLSRQARWAVCVCAGILAALEISCGPMDDLIDGRWYATAYHVQPRNGWGHVTVPHGREEVREG